MKELITRPQANMLILGISILGVMLAILGWKLIRSREWTGYGVILALIEPLWLVYNAIEDAFGLDSINAALFIALGFAGRVAWMKWVGRSFLDDVSDHDGSGVSDVDALEDRDAAGV